MKDLPPLIGITEENRRVYSIELIINGRLLSELIIDPHYQLKHGSYINDQLIYNLVLILQNGRFVSKSRKGNWDYFDADIEYQNKSYFLVWCFRRS